jgi:hypothetical protein
MVPAYSTQPTPKESTMHTQFHSTLIGLFIGAGMALACLSSVVVGMQRPTEISRQSITLPTVVVVARKASEPHTTAQTRATVAKNG